ncbi:MAG: class I SAM-dependent methyltransferase [Pseudomonadota bacterium]
MTSLQTGGPNQDQVAYWNSDAGDLWVNVQPRFDRLFAGITAAILDAANPAAGETILDIGAGAGDLSLALTERAAAARVVALDVSEPLLRHAQSRFQDDGTKNVETLLADAATHPFEPARFDLAVSRFGVMFFADPPQGFANIRNAMAPGARLAFACWAPLSANPWFSMPREAAVAVLGDPDANAPPPTPFAPGPFQLSDAAMLRNVLETAVFAQINIDTRTIPLFNPGALEDAVDLVTTVGPAGRIMREQSGTAEDLAAIRDRLSERMSQYVTDGGVAVPALIHIVTARA